MSGFLEGSAAPVVALICLHADPTTPPGARDGGGTHTYLREMLGVYAARGWRHVLLTRRADPVLPPCEDLSPLGQIRRLSIGPSGPLDKRHLDGLHDQTLAEAKQAIHDFGYTPDLLHSVYWNSGRAANGLAGFYGIPYVHTVISNGWRRMEAGYDDATPSRLDVERRVYLGARTVFCICSQERDDLVEAYGVPEHRIVVVGRPVAPTFLTPSHDGWGSPRRRALLALGAQ